MAKLAGKTPSRKSAQPNLIGGARANPPVRPTHPGRSGRNRWIRMILLGLCLLLMAGGIFQQVYAQGQSQTAAAPAVGQAVWANGSVEASQPQADSATRPESWYGLIASLSGAVVLWLSVYVLTSRRPAEEQ